MKISHAWLQTYFDAPLPPIEAVADALTFHVFEIDEIAGDMLDVKVLPDRAAYGLSHRGVAKELSAILNIPLKSDPLRTPLPAWSSTDKLVVTADAAYVRRHVGAVIRGVTVSESPQWLKDALASVGQRSINNIVDTLNYVTLNIGQPAGAFDLATLTADNGVTKIDIRRAKAGEKIKVLTGEEYTLTENMFVFTDAVGGSLLDIAGVKGGLSSGITATSKDIFISVGTYDPVLIRKTSQTLKLFTDASLRYQNGLSPELAAYGMRDVLAMIADIASGTLEGVDEFGDVTRVHSSVPATTKQISELIGTQYSDEQVEDVFKKLDLAFTKDGGAYSVTPPFERNDIQIPEDIAEEVGRIVGYEHVSGVALEAKGEVDQNRFRGIEHIKDFLVEHGFTEISTQSFAKKGDIQLANPLDVDRPYLRTELAGNMVTAIEQNKHIAPLVLKPKEKLKLFEIGTIFTKDSEHLSLVVSEVVSELDSELNLKPAMKGNIAEYDLMHFDFESYGKAYQPERYELGMFKQFSIYPFVLRDIAVWTPDGTAGDAVQELIVKEAGSLLTSIDAFDQFSKDGRTSYAFRLVFQSNERTLTDTEINEVMIKVTTVANASEGWQVR